MSKYPYITEMSNYPYMKEMSKYPYIPVKDLRGMKRMSLADQGMMMGLGKRGLVIGDNGR